MAETLHEGWEMEERWSFDMAALQMVHTRHEATAALLVMKAARARFVDAMNDVAHRMVTRGQSYSFKAQPEWAILEEGDKMRFPVYSFDDTEREPIEFEDAHVTRVTETESGPHLWVEAANQRYIYIVPLRNVEELRLMPLESETPASPLQG